MWTTKDELPREQLLWKPSVELEQSIKLQDQGISPSKMEKYLIKQYVVSKHGDVLLRGKVENHSRKVVDK